MFLLIKKNNKIFGLSIKSIKLNRFHNLVSISLDTNSIPNFSIWVAHIIKSVLKKHWRNSLLNIFSNPSKIKNKTPKVISFLPEHFFIETRTLPDYFLKNSQYFWHILICSFERKPSHRSKKKQTFESLWKWLETPWAKVGLIFRDSA